MERMTFAPTVAADIEAIGEKVPDYRIRAVTARIGEKVVAIGGLGFQANGTVTAFCHLTDEARHRKVALHKAVKAGIEQAKARGIGRIVATADPEQPAGERWLERLGFVSAESLGLTPTHLNGHNIFVWRADAD